MARRKHITLTTKLAAALLHAYPLLYDDAKLMTRSQFLSLFQWDHNILHESGHKDRDAYWNLTPLLIKAHREKTKRDRKVIAKGRRIRNKHSAVRTPKLRIGPDEARQSAYGVLAAAPHPARLNPWHDSETRQRIVDGMRLAARKRKLRSRGFDKTLRKKMDGTVVKR